MTKTENFDLNKPEVTDSMRLADFNDNADKIDAALNSLNTAVGGAGNCSIECGTYTGKGTYGSSKKNKLTFGIQPKIVFIFTAAYYGAMAETSYTGSAMGTSNVVFYHGGSKIITYYSGEGTMPYTLSGNTLTWYSTQDDSVQMNRSDTTYGYIAIG